MKLVRTSPSAPGEALNDMKICQQCRKTYSDDTLNFCLDDGTVLTRTEGEIPPPDTVESERTPATSQTSPRGTDRTWVQPAPPLPAPRKSSKSWLWILGIFFVIVLVCGGSLGGLALFGYYVTDEDGRVEVQSSDFSEWDFEDNELIKVRKSGGELILTSKDGYYYVFVFDTYPTEEATVKVTVRNTLGRRTEWGYGLVVHSHPTAVLSDDHAFLIDAERGEYRIVTHKDEEETELFGWTPSPAINRGSLSNKLEIRIFGARMDFYINGQKVKTVEASDAYKKGVAGIYTSDDVPIAFSNLELRN